MDEKLQQAQRDLQAFKQQLEFTQETTTQEQYQQRLEQLRNMNLRDADFSGASDYATAMALAQINIERRISNIEAEIQATQPAIMVSIEEAEETAPPVEPVMEERLGVFQRLSRWWKRTFGGGRSTPPATPPAAAPAAEPVQVEKHAADCLANINSITTASLTQRVQRVTPVDEAGNLVTPEELEELRRQGVRTSTAKGLSARAAGTTGPAVEEMRQRLQALEDGGMDFDAAVADFEQLSLGVGYVNINAATVAMVKSAFDAWDAYFENPHIQEYIRLLYSTVGQVLKDNLKDAPVTDKDVDDHIMEIFPTRGLECFRGACIEPGISMSRRKFATECSKLMSKTAPILKIYDGAGGGDAGLAALPETLRPLLPRLLATRARISEIGAAQRAERVRALNSQPPAGDGAAAE
jgi:hypothetical protein